MVKIKSSTDMDIEQLILDLEDVRDDEDGESAQEKLIEIINELKIWNDSHS